jgi:hypothetical protein
VGKLAEKFGVTNGLYTSETPINRGEETEPVLAPNIQDSQLEDIMGIREKLNKVHSEGYFENFYKKTDKTLKEVLHNKAVEAASSLIAPRARLEETAGGKGSVGNITINIVLPK